MRRLMQWLVFLAALPLAGMAQEPLDLERLTESEWRMMQGSSGIILQYRGLAQRMLRECPAQDMEPLLRKFSASAEEGEVYDEFRRQFGWPLAREGFDAAYRSGETLPLDCSHGSARGLLNFFADPEGSNGTLKSMVSRARLRPAGVIPATFDLAVTRLKSTPVEQFAAEVLPLDSTVVLAYEGQSGCVSVFKVRDVLSSRRESAASLRGSEYRVDWRAVSGVNSHYDPKPVTQVSDADGEAFASFPADHQYNLLGSFERLRIDCQVE